MRAAIVVLTLTACLGISSSAMAADDIYAAAVSRPGRPANDIKRDALDQPAEMLRLAAIKPGMRVADFLAGDGYYSELVSHIVGPSGHVLMLNNAAFEKWSDGPRQSRLANKRLQNVEHRTVEVDRMNLGRESLDAILMIKVYHDLYWIDATGMWPKIDVKATLDQVTQALKPGGTLLVVDHSAKSGTGSSHASSLHRIDEAFARREFESRGLVLMGGSDLLRMPSDARDKLSYQPPALGKTDRFALVFRKKT